MKKFFDKLKADTRFKKAGSGKQLSASTSASTSKSNRSKTDVKTKRKTPSYDANKAGQAALARFEAKPSKEVNWSQQALRARIKREMEAEKASEKTLEESRPEDNYQFCEDSELLAVDGVYFGYMLVEGRDTYEVIKEQIKEVLFKVLHENPGPVSCCIIHSCNKGQQKIQDCVETLTKCLHNITEYPTEEKYRKIRQSTRTYQERIKPILGAREFLQAAGFVEQILPHNQTTDTFWVFPEEKVSDLESIELMVENLLNCVPQKPELDRDVRVLFPQQAKQYTELPQEFFNLSITELRREMKERKNDIEQREMLLTKVMREKLQVKEIKKYRFTIIRIKFPNEIILQGTFGVYEKLEAVNEFIRSHLTDITTPFQLYLSGSGELSTPEDNSSLFELRFVPNVLLRFNSMDSKSNDNFLKDDTMDLLQ